MENFDLGIIGGGPAGYTSALYAAKRGKKVVLFEKDKLGGTCLNRGCIPTKILLHVAEMYEQFINAEKLGITAENISFNYSKITENKNNIIEKLNKSIALMLKNAGVTIINNCADIKSKNIIIADNCEYECNEILVCSGSKPRELKGLEFDHKFIINSDDLLSMEKLPKNILIVGSGAIGIEFARILSSFGVNVILTEIASRLIPNADWEVSKRIERQFKMKKIKYYTNTSVLKISDNTVTLSDNETITPDCILVAAGRIVAENDLINKAKEYPDIKIIGDAASEIQLAHYAVSQAKEKFLNIPFDKNLIPAVIYGTPEIAWVGKVFSSKEEEMEEQGYKTIVFPVSALGKAHCDGNIDGFIKIIAKNDKLAGASIVSNEASALIHQILIAIQNNISVQKLKEICFAHPTYSEGIMEGIMQL